MRALIEKLASVLNSAMSSAEHLSLSDVKMIQKKGSVIHITFKDCSTVEIVCVDDHYTVFNVEVVRKDDRSKMTHVSEETLMSVVKDVMNEVDANADGSVEKAHKKGVTPPDKTTKVPKEPETEELPGTEDIDVDELMEEVSGDKETKMFRGDKDAADHFKKVKSMKSYVDETKEPVIKESKEPAKPLVKEEQKTGINVDFERMKIVAGAKAIEMTEAEKTKKEALEKGEKVFRPEVGSDGKLRFVGNFRNVINRGV